MNKHKIILLVLSSVLFMGAQFSDVSTEHQFSEAIDYVREQGIVDGYPDGSFKPDNQINRAEFTKIVIETYYSDEEISSCNNTESFSDVPDNEWFSQYVCVAKTNDVVKGYSDGTFQPENHINYAEASKIITLAHGFDLKEKDGENWYLNYTSQLAQLGARPNTFSGSTFKTADAEDLITRGQMAFIIHELSDVCVDAECFRAKANTCDQTRFLIENNQTVGFKESTIKSLLTIHSGTTAECTFEINNYLYTSINVNPELLAYIEEVRSQLTEEEFLAYAFGGEPPEGIEPAPEPPEPTAADLEFEEYKNEYGLRIADCTASSTILESLIDALESKGYLDFENDTTPDICTWRVKYGFPDKG